MGISTRNSNKNLRKQAKMIKQKKDAEIIRNRKEKTTQEKLTIQLKEDQRDVDKRLIITDKTGHSKTMKENSINNSEMTKKKHTNNRMQKKPNDFGQKYGNKKTRRKG